MNLPVERWFKTSVAVAALVVVAVLSGTALANPISISISARPNSAATAYGYVMDQTYTFTWTLNVGFTNNSSSYFSGSWNGWADDYSYEAPIFSDFSGDGLTGSWQRPVNSEADPYSTVDIMNGNELYLTAFNEASPAYSIGLQLGGEDIGWVSGYAVIDSLFSFPGSYTDPNVYFSSWTGTYAATGGNINIGLISGDTLYFSTESLTISQIPEPSSGILIMLSVGGLGFIRRRLLM